MPLHIAKGDITRFTGECVVNAANESLLAGGGVCGAIHRAAGPRLELFCKNLAPCPTGQCVLTPAFEMACHHIIHAVGPRWQGGSSGEDELLRLTYENVYSLVREKGIKSVALPAISTGIYGFPLQRATEIAVQVSLGFLQSSPAPEITFYCFDDAALTCYQETINQSGGAG